MPLVVLMRGQDGGVKYTYSIVGVDESDVWRGLICWTSPLALALLKARADDVVKLHIQNGVEDLVVEVAYRAIRFDD